MLFYKLGYAFFIYIMGTAFYHFVFLDVCNCILKHFDDLNQNWRQCPAVKHSNTALKMFFLFLYIRLVILSPNRVVGWVCWVPIKLVRA